MKTGIKSQSHSRMWLAVMCTLLFVAATACGPTKEDKAKYHSEIKVIVDKAERNAEFVSKLMKADSSQNESTQAQIETFKSGIVTLEKYDADLKSAKAELVKVAAPKFEEYNLKASTDKYFDAQIKGVGETKVIFQELQSAMQLLADIEKETEENGEASEEKKAKLMKQLESINAVKQKLQDIETAMHNAKNEVLTNEEKFILQNSLTVTKFVFSNL